MRPKTKINLCLFQKLLRNLTSAGAPVDAIGLHSHLKGACHLLCFIKTSLLYLLLIYFSEGKDVLDWAAIKERIDLLWSEFRLPIWVTEFDWNGDLSVDFGDHSLHAEILENFHRLMFSHEVSCQNYQINIFTIFFKGNSWNFELENEHFK